MTTTTKVLAGVGTLTAIAVIYFGFTDKGKAKWASLTGSMGTDASGNSLPRTNLAEDAGVGAKIGADGVTTLTPRKPGFGSPFGSNGADGYKTRTRGMGVDTGTVFGGSQKKWVEPRKSSGGTLTCPKGYSLVTDKDGTFCKANNA